jgi:AraC-like DNA-binding protein
MGALAGRIRIMERWLLRRLEQARGIDAAVLDVIARIVAGGGEDRVGPLTRVTRLSERQLRRRFEAAVGLGPKHLARIVRLRAAMERAAATPAATWARIAADAGYYDQAHMIAEFRALTGRTPVELVGARA